MQCVGVTLRTIVSEIKSNFTKVTFQVTSDSPSVAKLSISDGTNTVLLRGFTPSNINFLTATTLGNYVKYWCTMRTKHKFMNATSLIVRGYINKYFNKRYIPDELNTKSVAKIKGDMIAVCTELGTWSDMDAEIRQFINLLCDKSLFIKLSKGDTFSVLKKARTKKAKKQLPPVMLMQIRREDVEKVTAETLVATCTEKVLVRDETMAGAYTMLLKYLYAHGTLGMAIAKQRRDIEQAEDEEKMNTPASADSLSSLADSLGG